MTTIEQAIERTNERLEQERAVWRRLWQEQARESGTVPRASLMHVVERCQEARDDCRKQIDAMLKRGINDMQMIGLYIAYGNVLEWLDEILGPQE